MSAATDLAALATGFSRSLRRAGLDAPPSATIDFAEALSVLGTARAESVFWAGRACFCRCAEDAGPYAETFSAFFGRSLPAIPGGRLTTVPPTPVRRPAPVVASGAPGPDDAASESEDAGREEPLPVAYSATETLRHKDFAACSEAELAEAERLMGHLRRRIPTRPGRRREPSRSPGRGTLDVRRTLRHALARGGDPARLVRRVRGPRARRVVLLLDVSGSMQPYARALLRFAHATIVAHRMVEAFTIGTRCTRVTRQLAWRDPDAALRRVATAAPDLEGGTRLGEGLREFNESWGLGGVARGAIVVLSSDGWDRGDPAVLAGEMARLARVAHRVVWVNPLKASDGYEPLVRGMAAALPYVDEFVSGHSLAALEELAGVISR
ncbi:MAG: VWA domain-containing protein [Acidimicrobiales bacterium]